jgi:hypothetical protein
LCCFCSSGQPSCHHLLQCWLAAARLPKRPYLHSIPCSPCSCSWAGAPHRHRAAPRTPALFPPPAMSARSPTPLAPLPADQHCKQVMVRFWPAHKGRHVGWRCRSTARSTRHQLQQKFMSSRPLTAGSQTRRAEPSVQRAGRAARGNMVSPDLAPRSPSPLCRPHCPPARLMSGPL